MVELDGVAVGYSTRRQRRSVLEGLDAELARGEMVCLLGPNGVGKSTLLRSVAGLQPVLSGRILIAGRDVESFTPRERARRVAVVLTEPVRVGMLRAEDLVALGRYPHTDWAGRLSAGDRRRVEGALAQVGASSLAQRLVGELSDGERQKVMIARAIAQDTDLLVLDEPTAFLDLARRVEVMAILRRLARETGRTLLMATHDLDLALRGADRLWLLHSSGGLESGGPEDLVLGGALGRLFASSLARFDWASGAFRLTVEEWGRARLSGGDGPIRQWTVRALARAGLRVVEREDGDARGDVELEVVVEGEGDRRSWRSRWQGQWERHETLHHLVARARRIRQEGVA